MRNFFLFISFSLFVFNSSAQETKIRWVDNEGREFSISNINANFEYTILSGDKLEYEPSYSDNSGKINKIGNIVIKYEPSYSDNFGKINKVGNVLIKYEPSYSDNKGKIKSVGGLTIYYEPSYSNSTGKIKSISGSVN
jgi:hypothetical protein